MLIVAHGNSLRALVKHLDGISDERIAGLNIPTGIPLVYDLDSDLRPTVRAAAISTPMRLPTPSKPSPPKATSAHWGLKSRRQSALGGVSLAPWSADVDRWLGGRRDVPPRRRGRRSVRRSG